MILNLRAAGTSLVLDCRGDRLPRVVHWGADLGDLTPEELDALARATAPTIGPSTLDAPTELSVLPEQTAGWLATPGITGHRAGTGFSTAFRVVDVVVEHDVLTQDRGEAPLAARVVVDADDDAAGLALRWELELAADGLVRTRATLVNIADASTPHASDPFVLQTLDLQLPVPREATEILDFAGRHLKERTPQRLPVVVGAHLRESRKARGLDATLLMLAGTPGFGNTHGQVWGAHVAWSGNTRGFVELASSGQTVIGGGELLLAGEIRLAPGTGYTSPWLMASWGRGLNEVSARFHRYLRSRVTHPRTERKALINVWEAVYFDHRIERLTELADAAAAAGLERYVLDDGWFRHRRTDNAGLGDWYVDEEVWPDGLWPIVNHVRELGLEFGLWFEPEMVNEDSDIAREHPEWILRTPHRMPTPARDQQVLDLTNPDAWRYLYDRIDAILTEYPIGYVKWDFNRDVVDAGRQAAPGRPDSVVGTAGVHEQTHATYRLFEALREAHPDVEFESCSSGGGRADLGILSLTDRIWTSDCIDPLERQTIEAGTGLLVPPELLGSHIASPHSHTTGRRHDLSFRAATAMLGHLGVEWDLTAASESDRAELAQWIALYRSLRPLLHSGDVVRGDVADPAMLLRGVVARDQSEAVFALVQVATSLTIPSAMLRLPGLDPDRSYRVQPLAPADRTWVERWNPSWWGDVMLPGRVLGEVGLLAPAQWPEHTVLLRLTAV